MFCVFLDGFWRSFVLMYAHRCFTTSQRDKVSPDPSRFCSSPDSRTGTAKPPPPSRTGTAKPPPPKSQKDCPPQRGEGAGFCGSCQRLRIRQSTQMVTLRASLAVVPTELGLRAWDGSSKVCRPTCTPSNLVRLGTSCMDLCTLLLTFSWSEHVTR